MDHLKWQNLMLPAEELEGVKENEAASLGAVQGALKWLQDVASRPAGGEEVNPQCIFELGCTLMVHSKLKYEMPQSVRLEVVEVLARAYGGSMGQALSMPLKSKLLAMLRNQLRKKTTNFRGQWEFTMWRELWDEAFGIVTRAKKHHVIASEMVLSSHVTCIIDLLHVARRFITSHAAIDDMVATATAHMTDTRTPACLQGLVLLVTCLPTKFARYDELLPQWVSIWNSIDHNAYWDSCWLTLFTRARKHTNSFDWRALSGKFALKARQMLKLPVVRGRTPNGSDFPNSFPGYYAKMMPNPGEPTQVSLNKLAKLLYFLTLGGADDDAALVLTEPITLTPANISMSSSSSSSSSVLSGADGALVFPGHNASASIRAGAVDIVHFLQAVRTYLYPSNAGGWTTQLAYFLTCLVNEMSRHVGHSVAYSLYGNSREGYLATFSIFEAPMHNTTVRFLTGTLTSIMMEGLYGRNPTMMQACSYGLKNLVGIDPSLGQIIVSFSQLYTYISVIFPSLTLPTPPLFTARFRSC